MSSQFLNQSKKSSISINNISIDIFSRPASFHTQLTSPTSNINVNGAHTCIIQTQPFTTPHDNLTQFKISDIGLVGRSSWSTGDSVKINILSYSGYNGCPFLTGYKESGTGNYIIDVANVVQTGQPPSTYALNGFLQISIEFHQFTGV